MLEFVSDQSSCRGWTTHFQDWPNGQEVLLGQLGLHFDMPTTKNQTEAYKDLTYLSQAVHAHCLTLSSSHFRLMRGSAAGTHTTSKSKSKSKSKSEAL